MAKVISSKNILNGKPRISGTRISIDVIGDYINNGRGVQEIKKDYPHLSKEQITSALSYIEKNAVRERVKLEPKST